MINILKLFKRSKNNVPESDVFDLFSESQCEVDDARLIMKKHCKDLDLQQVSAMIDEAWRQIGLAIFDREVENEKKRARLNSCR